jgi:hypothetical protein
MTNYCTLGEYFQNIQIYKMHNNLLTYKTIPNGLKNVES